MPRGRPKRPDPNPPDETLPPLPPPIPLRPQSAYPPLTHADVVAWVGEMSLKRAQPYLSHSVSETRRTGLLLKACCQGSEAEPYRVMVTLGAQGGIAASHCSCPVGGRCKHVAAVLLTWRDDPASFVEVEDPAVVLERLEKPALVALVVRMLSQAPELERLLEMLPPPAGQPMMALDRVKLRRQITVAFHAAGNDWGSGDAVADVLDPLIQAADQYATAADWPNATLAYQTIALESLERYHEIEDEGETNGQIERCVDGLIRCLQAVSEPTQRTTILRALFDIYASNLDAGGYGIGEEVPDILAEQTTPEERRMAVAWVRELTQSKQDWTRRDAGELLLRLLGSELDDEQYIRICRETGQLPRLVTHLSVRGEIDRAVAEARQAGWAELLPLADIMRAHGYSEQAERLVRERNADRGIVGQFNTWLRDRAQERGDLAEIQQLNEAIFWQQPNRSAYETLRAIAQQRGAWESLRPVILKRLQRQKLYPLLTEIHLKAGELAEALAFAKYLPVISGFGSDPLPVQVAHVAAAQYPQEALAIYRAVVDALIKLRGRDYYAQAARYLGQMREIYRFIKDESAWTALITSVRQEHRQLRALREELDRAKLYSDEQKA